MKYIGILRALFVSISAGLFWGCGSPQGGELLINEQIAQGIQAQSYSHGGPASDIHEVKNKQTIQSIRLFVAGLNRAAPEKSMVDYAPSVIVRIGENKIYLYDHFCVVFISNNAGNYEQYKISFTDEMRRLSNEIRSAVVSGKDSNGDAPQSTAAPTP